MSEVEARAKDAEVEKDSTIRPSTDEVLSESISTTQNKDEENTAKTKNEHVDVVQEQDKSLDEMGDSEAETLIQSPEKRRSIVDNAPSLPPPNGDRATRTIFPNTTGATGDDTQSRKRKRSVDDGNERGLSPNASRRSSPLSSPVAFNASVDGDSDHQSRRKTFDQRSRNDKYNGNRDQSQDSEDRVSVQRVRQRRPSDLIPLKRDKRHMDTLERRETRSATYSRHSDDDRSPSPQPIPRRDHRRGVSTQSIGHEFGTKKRSKPPLINTRRNRSAERAASVSSDDSNSPAPPRSAISKLTGQDHDTMSPAKTGPRKWRDKNGRTFLARACNNNDLESARARLAERPEDLNWADNAGNTPLQIAALEGFVDIVKYLLEAGCEVDTRNIDRETPLIDAVENGHVEVVSLLLDHGANPRLGNAKGDEPYELVPQDDEHYEEIRAMLAEAKERESKRHKAHEQTETTTREGGSSRAASAASPRDSPPINPRSPPTLASRRRTGRSESTRNDLLWQANTQENLTKLAGKGDVQGVASILNILQKAETESLIAAAKAGHEEVLQYLLGMGDPHPDPEPVRTLKAGFNTPMLAAIGKGHPDVVKLLVSQSGFNPMRKYKDKTYFELAKERKGEDWQQEHDILKKAYDNYALSRGRKATSPRKTREMDKTKSRIIRRSSSPTSQKRTSTSPTMTHKSLSSNKSSESSPKDKRKLPDLERRKTSGGKSDTIDGTVAVASDLEQTVTNTKKGHRVRRSQSDLPPPKLEAETLHRRRRLVTGKEHRRNKSSAPGSDSDEDTKEVIVVKQEDRPIPNLKRARSRSSMSPGPKQIEDSNKLRQGPKKRRTVLESSPDEARNLPKLSRSESQSENLLNNEAPPAPSIEIPKQEDEIVVADIVKDVPMMDIVGDAMHGSHDGRRHEDDTIVSKPNETEKQPQENAAQTDHPKTGSISAEVAPYESDAVLSSEIISEKEAMESEAREKAELEAEEEVERLAQIEAEKAAKAEAEHQRAEAVKKAAEEEEARRTAAKKEAEEAEIRRKAEEEAAIKKKQEEDRQEQLKREIEDRRRLQYLESERQRRETLPIVLNRCAALIDANDNLAQDPTWLVKFLPLFTVKTRQLELVSASAEPEEQWVANFQVASLLATKDLNLRNYTSFDKTKCTLHERRCLWRVARNMLSFEYQANGMNTSVKQATQREDENRPKFLAMEELFWVKLADFNDQVFRHPHLSGLNIRTQPISLASYASLAQNSAHVPQPNGTPSVGVKLANGIHTHNEPSGNGVEHTST